MADPVTTEPVSWVAIELVAARLSGVSRAAGYRTDLGLGSVSTDPAERVSADAVMHTLVSGEGFTEKPEASGRRLKVSDMDVTVEVFVPFSDSESAARLAHCARADVIRALSGGVTRAEEGVRSLEITGSSFALGATADGAAVVIAQVTARAGLAEPT